MATSAKTGPQDMPPPGGYSKIPTERMPLRSFFTAPRIVALLLATHIYGIYIYNKTYKKVKTDIMEMNSARLAILPIFLAERDRAFLKQLRKNRDEERELMKNDPEWDVGTYYSEPIYITRPEAEFREPTFYEFYAHACPEEFAERIMRRHFF